VPGAIVGFADPVRVVGFGVRKITKIQATNFLITS